MHYRSDIDGLRALAILLVLCFHFGLEFFPSGFIGVDIFFVISGFLIAEVIQKSIENHTFSLSNFYVRRLWRLQPMLITVLLFSTILAILFYLPIDLISYAKSLKSVTMLSSNQYFSSATTSYAAQESKYLLLLHTWSLSIEWQWYILFPAALYLIKSNTSDSKLKLLIIIFTISSLFLSQYLSSTNINKSYYFLSSRIFEFMIGTCISTFSVKKNVFNKKIVSTLGVLSLFSIIYIACSRNISTGYPNYYSVIVCLASALLIYSGSYSGGIINKFLSIRPIVFLGKISYSLYLWHWPILATTYYLGIGNVYYVKIINIFITFILSLFSYTFIEQRLRKSKNKLKSSIAILLVTPFIFSLLFYSINKYYNGMAWRFGMDYANIESTIIKSNSLDREMCFNGITDINNPICKIGDIGSSRDALLIGDSNSNHFWKFFDLLGKKEKVNLISLSSSSCLALPGIDQFKWGSGNKINTTCRERTKMYFDEINTRHYDYVVIGESWSDYLNNISVNNNHRASQEEAKNIIFEALNRAVNSIDRSGAQVIIVKEIPHMPEDYMACFYTPYQKRQAIDQSVARCDFSKPNSNKLIEDIFAKIKSLHPEVKFISPGDLLCHNGFCAGTLNGKPVYRDTGHITDYTANQLGMKYIENKNELIFN